MKNIAKLIISILICEAAGFMGSFFTTPAIGSWYAFLEKPSFSPPNWIFAPVWILLYLLMGVSLYLVWAKNWAVKVPAEKRKQKSWNRWATKLFFGSWKEENAVLVFSLQLALNIVWSIIFFGLKLPGLAFFEILMLWFAIVYTIANFHRISKLAAYLLLPYIF